MEALRGTDTEAGSNLGQRVEHIGQPVQAVYSPEKGKKTLCLLTTITGASRYN